MSPPVSMSSRFIIVLLRKLLCRCLSIKNVATTTIATSNRNKIMVPMTEATIIRVVAIEKLNIVISIM